MELLLWVLGGLAVAVGIAGTVLPALPGPTLVWIGLLLVAWSEGFARVGGWTLALLGLLALATYGIDLAASALGAKRVGASGRAIAGAALGGLVGILFGLPGLLAGPFLGAFLGELWRERDWRRAGRVGLGTSLGLALGIAAKLAVVAAMLGLFALAYLL